MKQTRPLSLDHVVINVHYDMDRAQQIFERLGFNLTARGFHSLGSINHLMTFDQDYLELVGLPTGATNIRREILESPIGVDGLVFKTDNAQQTYRRVKRLGYALSEVQTFGRPVEIRNKTRQASFKTTRLQTGQIAAGRVYYCQHLTPDLVWRKEWQEHANTAHAIAAMLIVSPTPSSEAKRYAALVNSTVRKGASGEYRVACADFELVFVTDDEYRVVYGKHATRATGRSNFFGAIALLARDLCSVREHVIDASRKISGLDWRDQGDVITLSIAQYGVVIDFIQSNLDKPNL